MLTVYHCNSHCTSHHPPRIIRGGFFHPFLLPPSHGQPTTASTSCDDSLVCRSVHTTATPLLPPSCVLTRLPRGSRCVASRGQVCFFFTKFFLFRFTDVYNHSSVWTVRYGTHDGDNGRSPPASHTTGTT